MHTSIITYSLAIYRPDPFRSIHIDNITEDDALTILGAFGFKLLRVDTGQRTFSDANDFAAYMELERA